MTAPEEQRKSGPNILLAATTGAVAGFGGGLLIPAGMGLLRLERGGLGGLLCFGPVGLLAGLVAGLLCVRLGAKEATPGFVEGLLSLFVGGLAGLLATLPFALLLQHIARGLNSIGHS
jgi:hypothetical protein